MTKLIFEQKTIAAQAGQSVLDALLQAGIRIPYSCRQGVCHSCLIRVTAGRIPPQAQAGLSPGQKEQNLMLACSCIPHSDLSLQRYDISAERVRCRVASKRMLRPDILELKLDGRLQYRAGQYVNLWRDEMINRSYSLASLPSDRFLSFHIDVRPDGQFSRWASESLNIGDPVQLQGPMGECVYQSEPDTPLLLAATGTGTGVLTAIARDALERGHRGQIHFLACGRNFQSMYWNHELQKLARRHSQFKPRFLVLNGPAPAGVEVADVYPLIREAFAPLNDHDVYLCGAPSFVTKLRKQCFLAGVRPRRVFFDAFEAGS